MKTLIVSLTEFLASLPTGFKAVPLLLLGWLAAMVVSHFVALLCGLLRVNRIGDRTGLSDFLRKGNVRQTPAQLIGLAAYWFVLGFTLLFVAKLLDVDLASTLSTRFVRVVPELVAASLVCIIGFVFVGFLSNLVRTLVRNAGVAHAEFAGSCIKWCGIFLVCALAIDQLGFAKALLSPLVHIIFGAIALALALAFGLGCKDIARDLVLNLMRELRERNRAGGKTDMEG